jgi:vitamin B12 transporter
MRHSLAAALLAAAACAASPAGAQQDSTIVLRGVVRAAAGMPIGGANVFLLETLDGTLSDPEGRFIIRTRQHGEITVVVRHIGFAPLSRVVWADTVGPIELTLVPQAATLGPITVQAGAYTAGNQRGATLTAIQVASTPGATADVARAIQTLPGVQSVDEGTGLFVRGGDVSETKVLLNDAVMLSPYNYETPTGNFTVTVNPFLLDGIFFSSGGFGVRYGNILSGVADLRTQGRPAWSGVTATAGLAAASTGADVALPFGLGVRATAAHSDTRALFRVNGTTRGYTPPPRGDDVSASVVWSYRPSAEVKTFAISRTTRIGLDGNDPLAPSYAVDVHSSSGQAGWKDVFGHVATTATVAYARVHRDEGYGTFALGNVEHWSQAFTQAAWSPSDEYTLRVGGDADWRDARFVGSLPATNDTSRLRMTLFDSRADGNRSGAFAEADWRGLDRVRVIGGVRTDYSSFTRVRTAEPRVSAVYMASSGLQVTGAWGGYHQVPDPLYFASGLGRDDLQPMFARQLVLGAQLGRDARVARLEVYDKAYAELVGLSTDKVLTGGGTGFARGADLFLKRDFFTWLSTRASYSYVDSRRTDPSTGAQASAPFDITHSLALVADQALPAGWSVSAAVRYATGKPFTPVTAATFDARRHTWHPQYGPPFSERLPSFQRLDLSLSRVKRLSPRTLLVYFASINNVFDRSNIYQYAYNTDYTQRTAVRSLFNRSFYIGGSVNHTGQ